MKIVLLINSAKQPNASMFLKEAISKGITIDKVVILLPPTSIVTQIKSILGPLKIFKPSNLKMIGRKFLMIMSGGE